MHCQLSPQGTMPCGCKTTLAALFLLFFTAYLFKKIAMYWACPCGPYLEYLTHPLLIKDWQNLIETKIKKGKCVKFQGQMWQISMANASNINGKCVKIVKGKCANGKWYTISRLTDSICEKFRAFFLLNMIPWYPKQILLHCEEAEKCIFNVYL